MPLLTTLRGRVIAENGVVDAAPGSGRFQLPVSEAEATTSASG